MLIDIKNTTKKIIAILIACPFGSVLADNLIEWPGYINNERCLLGMECGGKLPGQGGELGVFPDGNGTFYSGNISGLYSKLERLYNYGNHMDPENYLTKINITWRVKMIGHSSLDAYGSGIPNTNYQLKGWNATDTVLTLQIRRCLWDGQSTCSLQEVKPEDYINVTWQDISNNNPLTVSLKRNENVQFINVWMNHNQFRLYSHNPELDQYVRSIQLPGLRIGYVFQGYTQTDKPVNSGNTAGEDTVLPIKNVKLNDRTCKIVLNDDHDFGEFVVNDQQIGKLGEEKESIIKITCGKYGTNIRNSAGKQEWKEIQGTGKAIEGVHHTINNITIMPTYTVNIGNNVPKIGLSSNGTDVAPNLYIEGSLQQGKPCGVSAIEIGKATKPADFNSKFWADKDYKNPNDKSYIFEQPLDTIYWKVCKKEGVVDGGTYKGAVTIAIDFE